MRSKGFATKCYQAGKGERCKYLKLVDLAGIEPATSSMPWKRAPSCATGPLLQGEISLGFGVSARNL